MKISKRAKLETFKKQSHSVIYIPIYNHISTKISQISIGFVSFFALIFNEEMVSVKKKSTDRSHI